MVCLRKELYERELRDYANILGSETAAYYVLAMNNGYTLDKTPDGAPSQLYQDILRACNGNVRDAIKEKSVYYLQQYLNTNGNWIETGTEPTFNGLNGIHANNTVSQNVLQNDAYNEINQSLNSNGVDDKEYAMKTAIERTRQSYLDHEEAKFEQKHREENINKYNSRGFWKKVLGFFFSRYNKSLLSRPDSKDRQNARKQAYNEFNATLDHLILEELKTALHGVTGANQTFARQLADWIDKNQLDGNTQNIGHVMSFIDIARSNVPVTLDNAQALYAAVNMAQQFNTQLYRDGITLFREKHALINALQSTNTAQFSTAQQNYLHQFVNEFKNQFINQLKNVSNAEVEEASLMWQQRNSELISVNQHAYDRIKAGYKSRLVSIQKSSRKTGGDVVYKVKSKIKELEGYNMTSNRDTYNLYEQFLFTARDELNNALQWLDDHIQNGTIPSADDIMYLQTDIIGFYANIINEHIATLDQNETGLSTQQVSNLNSLYLNSVKLLMDGAIGKYNHMLDIYCDNIIDSYIDENYSLGDLEHHRRVLKAMLKGEINKGNLMFAENFIGDATQSASQIVRMIANMLNNDEREVTRNTSKIGHKLLKLYTKCEPVLSKIGIDPRNFMKMFCELDENGMPTGYFVRGYKNSQGKYVGINYGKFERAKQKKEQELRLKYKLEADNHGNTVWNFDIKGEEDTYNKYMDELDDWLGQNCHRRFTADYYKQRRRILTRQAREAIDTVQSQIQLLMDKCTDDDGFVYIHNLSPLERVKLRDLQHQKEQLATPYELSFDDSGNIISFKKKTGEALAIAESIQKWNKFIRNNIKRKPDWNKFNEARAKLSPAEQQQFDADNLQYKLSDQFYDLLQQCSTATQTEEYLKLSALRNKLLGFTKNKKGYTQPDLSRLTDDMWAELKQLEMDMAMLKTRGQKGSVNFDDVAVTFDVMCDDPQNPGTQIAVYDLLLRNARQSLSTNPNAINEFYDKYHYVVVNQHGNRQYKRLGVFSYVGPKNAAYIVSEPTNGYSMIDESSTFVDDKFNKDSKDQYQPRKSQYENKTYDKIMQNDATREFYEELLNVMDQAIANLPGDTNMTRYKMPQITADSSDIISRNLAKANIKGVIGSVSQHFTITENDGDLYREDLPTRPDGSIVETVPIRYVSTLENPADINCNIVQTVTQFFAMAENFKLKSKTVPVCNALISRMKGGLSVNQVEKGGQIERAQKEVEMYGYGRMQTGFGDQSKKMTTQEKFWTKFVNNFRSVANVALLAGNVFSAVKGFISAYYQTGTEALVGRYYDKGDRLWTTGQMLKNLPAALASLGQTNTKSKIQAAMQYNGLASDIQESLKGKDKIGLRRILKHFKMGIFTVGDYTINAIIMMSVYHATRLVENPNNGKLEFMTEEECIDAFLKQGKTEKEAIKYFEKHSGNHLYNMYELGKDGSFNMKSKVKIKLNDVEVEIDPSLYITSKVENRIAGTCERRASIANGVISKHGKGRVYQGSLTRLLVTMRGYLFSQGWDRLKGIGGADDFSEKYYEHGDVRTFGQNSTYRGYYDMETGHCEPGIYSSVRQLFQNMQTHWYDFILVAPVIYKTLRYSIQSETKLSKADLQNLHKLCLDIVGISTFMMMCGFIFIPRVREYPDEWWSQFMALVSMGCAIETATPVNPTTALDLMSTVSTTYSYVKNVQSISGQLADLFGFSGHAPTEYVKSGAYKNKPRWFRDVMKVFMKPTGLTGYYETFTPTIPGLDDPIKSKDYQRDSQAYNQIASHGIWDYATSNRMMNIFDLFSTPLGIQSKYDWYNHNAWPATWLPGRKDPDDDSKSGNGRRHRRSSRRSRKSRPRR